jgi:DNA polymerase I-like protein with 3'-5' exonuclease and polymerase domains
VKFLIHNSTLGSKSHFVINDDEFITQNHNNENLWSIDKDDESVKSLTLISALNLHPLPQISNEVHQKPFDLLGIQCPNWILSLGKQNFKDYVAKSKKYVENELKFMNDNTYYSTTFIDGRQSLFKLSHYNICMETLARHKKTADIRNTKLLQSFANNQKVKYSQSSSVTGRLSVTSGPNILHLKREHRNILTSRYGNEGAILQIDFKSLEPRILALLQKDDIPDDVYSDVVKFMGEDIGRDLVKKATLSTIYGMSRYNLATMLNIKNTKEVVEKINEYFGIPLFQKSLTIDLADNNKIQNFYGRNIFVEQGNEHLLINYFTQSTGVDVSLLGFNQIIDNIKKEELNVAPIFILHDALILDVHKDSVKQLKNMIIDGIIIPGFKQNRFPLELSLFYKRTKNDTTPT